ncbi:benzoylformate decarboxylase [Streptomyces sp. NPDC002514]|uniref:benzoylformate decarboxylase n=1 Tax=Streptomyces sp. NPDC001270 TaxID=3364554 RepID=UPI003692F090
MATVRECSFELLRSLGMTTVFGNPGSNELPFLDGLPAGFRYVEGLQEAAVLGMADGYAQVTGRATLVNLHASAGLGNAQGMLVNARTAGSPLVLTSGQQVRAALPVEPLLTIVDATVQPRPLVKGSWEPARPQDVPAALARAARLAVLPRSGPTFVSVPLDDWAARADDAEAVRLLGGRTIATRSAADPEALARLAERLAQARNPVLVVGEDTDACGGFDLAVRLAERRALPVWHAPSPYRCAFPTRHPAFRGLLTPGQAPLARQLDGHDLVLVVGAPVFRYHPYLPGPVVPDGAQLVLVTADTDAIARAPVGDAVLGDPALVLRRLLDMLPQADRPAPEPRAAPEPARGPGLGPEVIADIVARVMPDDTTVVWECPVIEAALWQRMPVTRPAQWFGPGGGGLGFGMSAAVGVQLARPGAPVLAVVGDGSAQYTLPALWTAAQLNLPVTWLIVNNGAYAVLKDFGRLLNTPGSPGLDLPGIDHVALAAGYGVRAERATDATALTDLLYSALRSPDPVLVDAPFNHRGR